MTQYNDFPISTGLKWYSAFSRAEANSDSCTKDRPEKHHRTIAFWGSQFLYGMAEKVRESPQETRNKILAWLEIMYKVATLEIPKGTKLRDVDVGHGPGPPQARGV
ncbi:hypothetical protein BGX29_006871 [Mortierella sp. GBA35]|nr:hypothetical protein BGX29_006871 [Mortierella sp. GBA35]